MAVLKHLCQKFGSDEKAFAVHCASFLLPRRGRLWALAGSLNAAFNCPYD